MYIDSIALTLLILSKKKTSLQGYPHRVQQVNASAITLEIIPLRLSGKKKQKKE